MFSDINNLTIELAKDIVENKSTIRATARKFNMAKSTVHYYLKYRLKNLDTELYCLVQEILKYNFDEKHIRGGLATKQKYLIEKDVENML